MIKQMGDSVLIVLQVLVIGPAYILVDVLEFDEQQGNTVDKSNDIWTPPIRNLLNPQFADHPKIIVKGITKIKDLEAPLLDDTLIVLELDRDTALEQPVFLPVSLEGQLAGTGGGNCCDG